MGVHRWQAVVATLGMVTVLASTSGPRSVQAASSWYVSISGNDANSCLIPTSPCLTIGGAITKAVAGDIIKVASGVYTAGTVLLDRDLSLLGGWDSSFIDQAGASTIDGQGDHLGL